MTVAATSTGNSPKVQALVDRWLSLDQDSVTRDEITRLSSSHDEPALLRQLGTNIEFGTAGLRARMEAGFARMNKLTVIQATQGLCSYILKQKPNQELSVVIGHDHRYNSKSFARLAAAVFLSKGVKVYLYRKLVHTPMVPFGVQMVGAACGIMITASHNPKQDNGYKVYWDNACQIIPPVDAGIAAEIAANPEPWVWDENLVDSHPLCEDITEKAIDAYYASLSKTLASNKSVSASGSEKPLFVYTAMHGVGLPFAQRAFKALGLAPFFAVDAQCTPDPDFPTVRFPNPEEKGALDMAIATADAHGISIVLANDPDADRFAAAEKQTDGTWRLFTGNQVGTIFAAIMLERSKANGQVDKIAMLNSTVSSKMLESIAKKEGFKYAETLTGFKWLGNTAISLTKQGHDVVFAYEEALGYMIGDIVRDKDGISALAVFADYATQLAAKGKSMTSYLEELYAKYGFFASDNSYFVCHSQPTITAIFDNIRYGSDGGQRTSYSLSDGNGNGKVLSYPTTLAGRQITYIRDLTIGFEVVNPLAEASTLTVRETTPELPVDTSTQMITLKTHDGCVLTIRTSGTEPKIKYYIEMRGEDRASVQKSLQEIVKAVGEELLHATTHGLIPA
ncbi:hypothetical protein GQ42DRAFT_23314 [Ramicandelaber brevisporus]|nr:hypothetical protein GQ42DRAFT_23314 [Ramicandelaber brevisporus]